MDIEQLLRDLTANNQKTDGTHLDLEALRSLARQASTDVPGAAPDATTVLYSNYIGDVPTEAIAEVIGSTSGGSVRTIGQTEAGKLLSSQEFQDAVLKAANDDRLLQRDALGHGTNGMWAEASGRFVDGARGDVMMIAPNAEPRRTLMSTEIPRSLNNLHIPNINGIPAQNFRDMLAAREAE